MCNCNCNVIKSTLVTVTGSAITVTIPSTTSFVSPEKFNLAIMQDIPISAYGLPISVTNGSSTWSLFDKCGNYVFGGEVRTGRIYKVYYSDFPSHLTIVSDNLNRYPAKCVG